MVSEPRDRQVQSLDNHLGAGHWVVSYIQSRKWVNVLVVMSFRPEAFRLDLRHVQFWRGCVLFLLKRS